eukprot:TRINITY_DN11319_c0_g1_i1.p1 TRINITY_DN11319_c0_g1~~TRINITY_DN11319_c0_g1_i1.p1  ORF type:complete len:203 (-),score=45.27 TRINITY_DN11319_c0_g1_i1:42-614(-)
MASATFGARVFSCFCNPFAAKGEDLVPNNSSQETEIQVPAALAMPKPKNAKGWSAFENSVLLSDGSTSGTTVLLTMDGEGIKLRKPDTEEVLFAYSIRKIKSYRCDKESSTFEFTYVTPDKEEQDVVVKSDEYISMQRTFARCIEETVAKLQSEQRAQQEAEQQSAAAAVATDAATPDAAAVAPAETPEA